MIVLFVIVMSFVIAIGVIPLAAELDFRRKHGPEREGKLNLKDPKNFTPYPDLKNKKEK